MDETALRQAYEAQKPVLLSWGRFVRDAVITQLRVALLPDSQPETFLTIWPVEPRVKGTDSFLAKALRRGKDYHVPLEEITDKVGVRFVTLLLSEIRTLVRIVQECSLWEAEKSRDFEHDRAERPHLFDYQSVHFIVRSKDPHVIAGETVPSGTACEVQIRTLLQHAYSELAHDTVYKPRTTIDRSDHELSRQVAKSMALIEATDDIFLSVSQQITRASDDLRRAFTSARTVYEEHVCSPQNTDLRLSDAALDPYREFLPALTVETLVRFLADRPHMAAFLFQKAPLNLFFANPVSLIVCYLAENETDELASRWPFEPRILDSIFAQLGISSDWL